MSVTETKVKHETKVRPGAEQPLAPYVTAIKESGLPVLGMLSWYTVAKSSGITQPEWSDLVELHQAPLDKIAKPNVLHVFRRACSLCKISGVENPKDHAASNFDVKNVSNNKDFIVKAIVEEVVDEDDLVLEFRTIADVIMSKSDHSVQFVNKITDSDYAMHSLVKMQDWISTFVDANALMLHDMPIREAARRAVEITLNGVRVRQSGAVYFTSLDRAEQLEAVAKVINSIPDARFDILPLIDDGTQRDMLLRAFQDEAMGNANELITEMAEILRDNKAMPVKSFIDITDRFSRTKQKIQEYSVLLGDTLEASKSALQIAEEQINTILDHTEIES